MSEREKPNQQFPLPVVDTSTIYEAIGMIGRSEEEIYRLHDSSPLFRYLYGQSSNTYLGGLYIYCAVRDETTKQKMRFWEPSKGTVDEYRRETEKRHKAIREELASKIHVPLKLTDALEVFADHLKSGGSHPFTYPATYKPENPALMDFIALDIPRTGRSAHMSEVVIGQVQTGAIQSYELLRLQAIKRLGEKQ